MKVKVKRLHPDAEIPFTAHESDFGYDVKAVSVEKVGFLTYRYHTGLAFQVSHSEPCIGYKPASSSPSRPRYKIAITARPRSSVWKTGMLLCNAPGTVDYSYTGEVTFVYLHIFPWRRRYRAGDRIGQIHIDQSPSIDFEEVDSLEPRERGEGREGSTGR